MQRKMVVKVKVVETGGDLVVVTWVQVWGESFLAGEGLSHKKGM
jgi:hypothetical protein